MKDEKIFLLSPNIIIICKNKIRFRSWIRLLHLAKCLNFNVVTSEKRFYTEHSLPPRFIFKKIYEIPSDFFFLKKHLLTKNSLTFGITSWTRGHFWDLPISNLKKLVYIQGDSSRMFTFIVSLNDEFLKFWFGCLKCTLYFWIIYIFYTITTQTFFK